MVTWTKKGLEDQLRAFTGGGDPNDPKERKRLRIIEAATDLFARFGYRKTSIDEVARQAGVAKGTVYLYFSTKGDLLMQAIVQEKMLYAERFLPVLTEEMPPKERLRALLRASLKLVTEMPLTAKVMSGDREVLIALDEVSPEMREKIPAVQQQYFAEVLAAAAGDRWTPEELAERAKVIVGLLYASGFVADPRIRGGLSVDRFAEILADLLTDGIAEPQGAHA